MQRHHLFRQAGMVCLLVLLGAAFVDAQQPAPDGAQPVVITVRVPAGARVEFDGNPTQSRGEERRYVTPPLPAGKTFTYTIAAIITPNNYVTRTRERKVTIEAGKDIEVDLRNEDKAQPDKIVIRFVPTPQEVVEAMCKLGGVSDKDVVYDLGCGDGRIVITAVAKFHAKRGVGVDLDPMRIKESKENAKREKVADKVEFRQGDVLQIKDLSEASVVMLYMSDDLNLALRPLLQKSLKPGARIVSHRFIMGDWKPDKTETIKDAEGTAYKIHLWRIEKKPGEGGTADTGKPPARGPYGDISDLKLAKPEDKEDVKSTPPPAGAKVLFDGKDLSGWVKRDGKSAAEWTVLDGGIMQVKGGDIRTKETFDGHFKLHVEFRVPYLPDKQGQARGNSGVYVQGRYEVQVLDSYGLQSKNNDCGAIYEVSAPSVNACKAPTVWQSYDIEFYAPKCKDGKKVEPARMTVYHNGVKIQDDVKIPVDNTRAGLGGDPCQPGPILLQDHGNPVQFRNVWLEVIKDK